METKNNCETLQCSRVSRIIQIHPSLYCNLCCKHCYSSSAPQMKTHLDFPSLAALIEQGHAMGYNVISLSGGEPFLYKHIEELMAHSKSIGFFNSVTTNGMLLRSDKAKRILKNLDLVAVSVDGKEDAHDKMRNQPGAFRKMLEGIEVLKDSIDKYGFIHTILPGGWQLFPWLTELAIESKASLLHLHPLEFSGRAKEHFSNHEFSPEDIYKIYIAHAYLQLAFEKELFIQLDLLHRDNMSDNPNFVFHQNFEQEISIANFSSLFKELVIDEDGDILPIAHGCSKFLKIGNIYSGEKLSQMAERFLEEKMRSVTALYQMTYDEILNNPEFEIFNWSELVIQKSQEIFAFEHQ